MPKIQAGHPIYSCLNIIHQQAKTNNSKILLIIEIANLRKQGKEIRVKDLSIKLPIKETEEIDWEFMEDYIKAIQKIVIKDVVKYKDEVIAKTKEAVAG